MWYIRFLKVPECKISPSRSKDGSTRLTVRFTITITTDLGEDFLAGDKPLTASLVKAEVHDENDNEKSLDLVKSLFSWPCGKRSVTHKFDATLNGHVPISSLRLLISQRDGCNDLQTVLSGQVPQILSIWSDFFDSQSGKSTSGRVQRRFPIGEERFLKVWEETGESIARHIWDAGIAIWLYVLESITLSRKSRRLSKALQNMPKDMIILELGSGCGIGGLMFALTVPKDRSGHNCKVLLTDLPEAIPILEYNISQNQYAEGCTVESQVLKWEDEESLELLLGKSKFDIVLVSDCTYNCDSCPALVKTLSAVAQASNPYVIVSMKVRHETESVFFALMEEAGFATMRDGKIHDPSHDTITLPHNNGSYAPGESYQMIDIYIFRMREVEAVSSSNLDEK